MSSHPSFSSVGMAAVFAAVLALASTANGCGSDGDSFFEDPDASASGGSSGSTGTSGFGSNGGGDGSSGDGTGDDGGGGDGGTCARGTGQTALLPLDMFILFDRSISMSYDSRNNLMDTAEADCNTTQNPPKDSRWCKSVVALSSYLNSQASAGNRAALQFFGPNNACDGNAFTQSVQPGGRSGYTNLPTNLFDDNLNAAAPDQYTPMEGAVRGLIAFTARPENRAAGRRTISVLITDADTSTLACSSNITMMRDLLQGHFTRTGVRTFVIGMAGADFGVLETLATGGNGPVHADRVGAVTDACGNGNGPCRSWNVGNGNGNVLAEAMKAIQQTAVGCKLRMPKPETGTLDLNQVEVEYLRGGNPPPQKLTRVANAAACVPQGFYYDNNANPANIELCPALCTTVSADPKAKLSVIAACVRGASGDGSGGIILK